MKTLLDRADAALKIRREKLKQGKIAPGSKNAGMEGLVDDLGKTGLGEDRKAILEGSKAAGNGNDEWEVLQHDAESHQDEEVAIRVDQYLVVFLKVTLAPLATFGIRANGCSSWQVSLQVSSTILLWVFRLPVKIFVTRESEAGGWIVCLLMRSLSRCFGVGKVTIVAYMRIERIMSGG